MRGGNNKVMTQCRKVAITRISTLISNRQFSQLPKAPSSKLLFTNYAISTSSLIDKSLIDSICQN